jgi:hypothetical protein
MSDPPRRRRSTPPPSRRSSESSSLLPTVALGVGVVVAGLGIGAFLSAMQHRGASTTTTSTASQGAPVVTPVARATRGPVAIATVVPHATDTPTPRPTATPQTTATPAATATPRETATPRATATPAGAATVTPTPRATQTPRAAETKPPATPTPVVVTPRPATARPTPHPATPRPTLTPTAVPIARATPLTFAGIAQNTVRRYLSDLIAGNENAAYAELGKSPGDGGLSEEAFIDRGTRITSIRTTSSDANGATVEVGLTSSRGSYYATYHVTNGPSGPVIDQHDYIKV